MTDLTPENGILRFILIDSYPERSGRPGGRSTPSQMKWQIYHLSINGNLRFILIDSYSESSGRPGGRSSGRSTPPENGNFRFILIHSCSKSSDQVTDQVADLPPPRKWQFQIHTDRFLL